MARGVVAVGDSITNACSLDLAYGGIEALSWAQRVAQSLRLPLEVHARPGEASGVIRRDLLPAIDGVYRLALVYVGVNNIISWQNWRREDLRGDLDAIVGHLRKRADRVAVMGFPATLGKTATVLPYGPGLAGRIRDANAAATVVAGAHGALLIPAPPLSGDEVWIDGVHPTSLGHLEMARATLTALGDAHEPLPTTGPVADSDYPPWRRREAAAFAWRAPARGIGKWLLAR